MSSVVWSPSESAIAASQMMNFMVFVNGRHQLELLFYPELHAWSVAHPGEFWAAVWDWSEVKAHVAPRQSMVAAPRMQDTQWMVGSKLNFAENLLSRKDDHLAISFTGENGFHIELSYAELWQQVAALAAYLRDQGVTKGDRVCAMVPNFHLTVVCMLAVTSLGAIWSSCSPDFGVDGLLMRFEQIEPVILVVVDGHFYNGKVCDHAEKISQLQKALTTVKKTILLPYIGSSPDLDGDCYGDILEKYKTVDTIDFVPVDFSDPVYILFSSGTTGAPKCMVHGVGGVLLQHLKEHRLHVDLRPDERMFFYTTCGWMMWNWLVSALSVGATLVLYDGSLAYPEITRLYDLIESEKINVFGVGAKFLEICEAQKLDVLSSHSLPTLRTILTTGSPLLPASFDYIHHSIKPDVQIASISGGSDIVSCFALGNPILPVYRGELQAAGLGMDVQVYNDDGRPVIGEQGELVCCTPFPCMPVEFWNDPEGTRYQQAYFEGFPGVWTHGDYAKMSEHEGLVILGRSDTTLNPGGVRIGTAEFYQELEEIVEIEEACAVGQKWQNDERIVLFVVLNQGRQLDDDLTKRIKVQIRCKLSPKHVPAVIIQAPDLPRTANGKLVEIAVKKLVNNQPVKNKSAIVNPACLDFFQDRPELLA